MQDRPTVLVGIREISEHLRRSPRVVRRLIREGLPATLEHGAYMTTTQALEGWINERAVKRDTKRYGTDTNKH
jgi:hypothetical protein